MKLKTGITRKLLGSFLGTFIIWTVIISTFIVWSYFVIGGLIATVGEMETISERAETTGELRLQLEKLLKTSGDYLITGEVEKRDEFDVIVTRISDLLNELGELTEEAGETPNERRYPLPKVRDGAMKLSGMTIELMFIGDPVGNMGAAKLMKEATIFGEKVILDAEEFHKIAEEDRKLMAQETSVRISRTKTFLYILPPLGLFVFIMLYLYLRYYITKPLTEFYKGADRIAKGDFDHSVEVKTGDELEGLADGFNRMATALKEREAKLLSLLKVADKINEELIATSQHKTSFLANISHELKTPLTHILGFSELLKMEAGGKLPDSYRRYADYIYKSGKDLLELINSMLEVTRVTGVAELELKKFPVREAIDEVVKKIVPDADKKKLDFKVELDEELGLLKADKNMFSQILTSLLSNAVKFTPKGGSVRLWVSQTVEVEERVLKMVVEDTGIGIRPEDKETVFESFEVGDLTPTREFGGLGIGLALTKRFVEFHGGKITVESELGKGSTFVVLLPIGRVEPVGHEEAESEK
jgi:signal transduction histidine kinase